MNLDCLHDFAADEEKEPDMVKVEDETEPDALFSEEDGDDDVKVPEVEHFDDAIKLYLREIQKRKLLTADEERELAVRIAKGDKSARDRMIESNLRLVVKIAKRHANRGLPLLDLIEEGNLGLIKAVDRFKISKECRFSTYATWWIRQSIERAIINQSRTVRLPVHIADDVNKMFRCTRELVRKLNREPSAREVAEKMEVDIAHVRRLMVLEKKIYSIEQHMGEENDFSLLDTMEDTSSVSAAELIENLNKYEVVAPMFETLPDNEKNILSLRFGLDDQEPQTLDTIGRIYGVTRERIRQIEARALERLRTRLEELQAGVVDLAAAG